jgi:hypothetical protein
MDSAENLTLDRVRRHNDPGILYMYGKLLNMTTTADLMKALLPGLLPVVLAAASCLHSRFKSGWAWGFFLAFTWCFFAIVLSLNAGGPQGIQKDYHWNGWSYMPLYVAVGSTPIIIMATLYVYFERRFTIAQLLMATACIAGVLLQIVGCLTLNYRIYSGE